MVGKFRKSAPTEHHTPTTTSGAAVDTTQHEDTGAAPKAPDAAVSAADTTIGTSEATSGEPEGGYPEQMHAGKLGYGPNAPSGGGIPDRLKAKEEIIKGKLTHNEHLLQQGHDREAGLIAERRRQYDAEQDTGPFSKKKASGDDEKKPAAAAAGDKKAEDVRESGHAASADAATASTKAV